MATHYLGVDIGGTKSAVCLGDQNGMLLDKRSFPTNEPAGPEDCIKALLTSAHELLRGRNTVKAIGIACGSPLDPDLGIIQSPANLKSWVDVPIVEIFSREFSLPAYLDNDANAGALAEYCFGAGKGCRHMAFLTFGTGMGAGLILNGQIYRGANCYAGEIGHFRLAPEGPIGCRKAGSFEGFCSGGGIAQLGAAERKSYRGATSLSAAPSAKEIGTAAEQGDALAIRILEISGDYLGRGLALLIDCLNLERVIIGSIFARCEKFLRPAMERSLQAEALAQPLAVCKIMPAGLGEQIGDLAALSIAYSEYRKNQNVSHGG
ncbi:MAG: ROK family protein [Oligoflexia bacterium]|nr:ROK family protein [Oligoflexia bacterium]